MQGTRMGSPAELVSPKHVARAMGVSESSLKRWCDQGLIKTVRTAGGHRKMRLADVLRFLMERDQPLAAPEVLGLPPGSDRAEIGLHRGGPRLADALLAGDELLARQVVFDLRLARHPLSAIFDGVIAAAFREIGDRWACKEADVYQERRGCEICLRILFEIRKVQQPTDRTWLAMGGTIEGDPYALPTAMAELVLRESGFHAISLGASIPVESLVRAVQETRPNIFWLSVSHLREGGDFVADFMTLSQACNAAGTALVVGGRALTESTRQQMTYSAYCDTMQHLEGFATALRRSSGRGPQSRKRARLRPTRSKGVDP